MEPKIKVENNAEEKNIVERALDLYTRNGFVADVKKMVDRMTENELEEFQRKSEFIDAKGGRVGSGGSGNSGNVGGGGGGAGGGSGAGGGGGAGGSGGGHDERGDKGSSLSYRPIPVDPELRFDSKKFIGMKREIAEVTNNFILPFKWKKLFGPVKNLLLYGPPGGGKTYFIRALVNSFKKYSPAVLFFAPSNAAIKGKFAGDIEKNLVMSFSVAQTAAVDANGISILFFDEFESLAGSRSSGDKVMNASVTQILTLLEGSDPERYNRVIVAAATNLPWSLDEAVLRRFSTRIFIDLPDRDSIPLMVKSYFNDRMPDLEFSPDILSQITDMMLFQKDSKQKIIAKGRDQSKKKEFEKILSLHESKDGKGNAIHPLGFNASDIRNFVNSVINDVAVMTLKAQRKAGQILYQDCKYYCPPEEENCNECVLTEQEIAAVKLDSNYLKQDDFRLLLDKLQEFPTSVDFGNYADMVVYCVTKKAPGGKII